MTRYYDEGDPNPKYMITETDLKTNEQRSYRCDLRSESTLDEAKAIVISELTEDLRGFIAQNYGDVVSWVGNAIEASIYKLKN